MIYGIFIKADVEATAERPQVVVGLGAKPARFFPTLALVRLGNE